MEPCPKCGSESHAEFVDVGVGMIQAGPYYCSICGWVEAGCSATDCERCKSWDYCQGRSILTEQSSCSNCNNNDGYECRIKIGSQDMTACDWERIEPIGDLF